MKQMTLITKLEQLEAFYERVQDAPYLAYDSETTGLKRFSEVVGVSFAVSAEEGYYIPIKIWKDNSLLTPWSPQAFERVLEVVKSTLLHSKRLVTHNGGYDAKVTHNTFKIDIIDNIFSDTQLLHHTCVNESESHALKFLGVKYVSSDADNPQLDLKQSVLANGGRWVKEAKEMYKGDWKLLGNYAIQDVLLTYALFEMWQPEIEKQGLQTLWYEEVMPLMKVTYELNTTGLRVNIPYFEKLKTDMTIRIESLEDEIYAMVRDKVRAYEVNKLKEEVTITKRSEIGKALLGKGLDPENLNEEAVQMVYEFYTKKKEVRTVFNLNSGDDKAFLIYDVLGIPCTEFTASGKRSTAKSLMDKLAEENADKAEVLKLLRERSKEMKLLNTYVLAVLESHENGRIYPNFMQTGTTSGRYSCGGSSLNMQTLPRDDYRVKAGFIPDDDYCFVAADYSSLEPRSFAEVSEEPKIQKIFSEGLDFYSSIAIDVLGLTGVSAKPEDPNYLGTVDKSKRQFVKAIALAIPYGAQGGRLSQIMGISYDEATEIYNKYLRAYPVLHKWMERSNYNMKTLGFVSSRMGRKKRGPIVHELFTKYSIKDFSKKGLERVFNRLPSFDGITDSTQLYLECRNSLNVAKNHQIQSMAASICNAAMLELKTSLEAEKLNARLVLQIHDEIVLSVHKDHVERVSQLLQHHMESNKITSSMRVPMIATPVVTDKSLADAK